MTLNNMAMTIYIFAMDRQIQIAQMSIVENN